MLYLSKSLYLYNFCLIFMLNIMTFLIQWLDNCATWDLFLPCLFKKHPSKYYVVALDFAGHGFSDHRSLESDYLHSLYAEDTISVLHSLQWESVTLLGHSLGGIICTIVAAIYRDRIKKVISIESLGRTVLPNSTEVKNLKHHIKELLSSASSSSGAVSIPTTSSNLKVFSSIEEAAYVRSLGRHPVSLPGSTALCERGLNPAPNQIGWIWSSDPRLLSATPFSFQEATTFQFLSKIKCPVLVIFGDDGMFEWFNVEARLAVMRDVSLVKTVGSHHLHLEPDTVEDVAQHVEDFLVTSSKRAKL